MVDASARLSHNNTFGWYRGEPGHAPTGLPLTALMVEYSLSPATMLRYVNEECAIRGVSGTGFPLHHAETKGALR